MKWGKWLAYGITILAVVGLISQLITNPTGFARNILMMVGIAVIIGALLYFLLIRNRGGKVDQGYKKALKQSQRKYGKSTSKVNPNAKVNVQSKSQRMPRMKRRTGNQPQLRVIKGNKK